MKTKRKALIIEYISFCSKKIREQVIKDGFHIVGITGKVYEAIDLVYIHDLDLITINLTLEDGMGLTIIESIVANMQRLKKRPFVAVISKNISDCDKNYITDRLTKCKINFSFYDKASATFLQRFSNDILKLDGYFYNNGNPYFEIVEEKELTMVSFENIIRGKLRSHPIIESSTPFDHYAYLILVNYENSAKKLTLPELCEIVHKRFNQADTDSILTSIKRVKLPLTPKKFITRITQELKEEYADFDIDF